MGLSYLEIERVIEELSVLQGALLKEVYQPSRSEFIFSLRCQTETFLLLFSLHQQFSRLHRIDERPHNPDIPFPFQMICRKELGGRLHILDQPGRDRAVRLVFRSLRERTVVFELTGRHGNAYLLDEGSRIMASQFPTRAQHRPQSPGQEYVPLPPPKGVIDATDRFMPFISPSTSYEHVVKEHFDRELTALKINTFRQRILREVHREIKRLVRRQTDIQTDLHRAERAEQHRLYGDILQIYLQEVPRGVSHVILPNPFQDDGSSIEIPLAPELGPVANAQRHYRLYRKYDTSIPIVLERLECTEKRLNRLLDAGPFVESATTMEQLEVIINTYDLTAPGPAFVTSKSKKRPTERSPYHTYLNPAGFQIWVGRGAADNESMTFREARGNDFWLHVRGRPGAHVVIPARGRLPDLETLIDAGCLAMIHSGFSDGDKTEVSYTRVKHVRKVAGPHPGRVTYSQDKTLLVKLETTRLRRLSRAQLSTSE